ncbi:hypothetical protein [Microvirga lotononidis]|uniref:Uncharacterized protein n=1 Tax=Microvirga lotononidis TaxID=864069 RepID=I4YNZ8_9HYPH|nr:hypothetical protein [Microvirga lotononidis]EIM25690.1 hypothetical protein MicloDRAFT_00064170 [Microvirga lotononidis]WQO25628.1 hypothetical protein U0023_12965 [Microvirga lotononidis]
MRKKPVPVAERMRLYRKRKREGILDVVFVPVTFPQANWLIKHGYLDRKTLSLDMPPDDRRKAIGEAIAKLVSASTQTKVAA